MYVVLLGAWAEALKICVGIVAHIVSLALRALIARYKTRHAWRRGEGERLTRGL